MDATAQAKKGETHRRRGGGGRVHAGSPLGAGSLNIFP